jgi:hypothetical protein
MPAASSKLQKLQIALVFFLPPSAVAPQVVVVAPADAAIEGVEKCEGKICLNEDLVKSRRLLLAQRNLCRGALFPAGVNYKCRRTLLRGLEAHYKHTMQRIAPSPPPRR